MRTACPYCEGRGRVLSAETMSLRVRRELRRLARTASARAILVEVHPQVRGLLFRDGDAWLRELEERSGKGLVVRGREGQHLERINVTEAAGAADLEREPAVTGTRRTQVAWLDGQEEETVEISEEEDETYERALAAAESAGAGGGLVARIRQLLTIRRS